jgi:hypothetical protein
MKRKLAHVCDVEFNTYIEGIIIIKYLLHRNLLKYMWGYTIFPTTNLPHYHSKYSCEWE